MTGLSSEGETSGLQRKWVKERKGGVDGKTGKIDHEIASRSASS
jgi:hypothetical protein